MRWETGVAIFLAPLVADLIRRYEHYQPPFDGSWTVARVVRILIGKKADKWSAGRPQIGRDKLPALPPPSAHEVVSEESTVSGASEDGGRPK